MAAEVRVDRKAKRDAIRDMALARTDEVNLDETLRFLDKDHRYVNSTRHPSSKVPKPGYHTVLSSPPVGKITSRRWDPVHRDFVSDPADIIDSQTIPDRWTKTDRDTVQLWKSNEMIVELNGDCYQHRHVTAKDLRPWCKQRLWLNRSKVVERFEKHRAISGKKRCPESILNAVEPLDFALTNLVEFYEETRLFVYATPYFNNASWDYDLQFGFLRVRFMPPYYPGKFKIQISYGTERGWSDVFDDNSFLVTRF